MLQNFEDLNDNTIFTKVKSHSEALKMKDEAKKESLKKNIVIFFENRYHLYLMPGQDPYQIRKEIEAWVNQTGDNNPTIAITKTKSSKSKLKS